ncbi:MAG: hypothetical protein GX460_07500 [Firmicutes bacterium]|nr:hypothetical protein [Bacillota bacterium]
MPEKEKGVQLYAVVLVGMEEGAIEIPLVRAISAEYAISAALHDSRWEGYACPVALDIDAVQSLCDSMQAGQADLDAADFEPYPKGTR